MKKKKVWQYIEQKKLLAPGEKVLVALSGGADSVALLRLLLEYGCRCEAAHCNFRLREAESDRDEAFVRTLCAAHGVPLHVTRFDTRGTAARRHLSLEMAARELRYAWFEEVRRGCGASCIAVAHHADDSVETFLLNLIRGTGIEGLRGIRPRNGNVVRPLLCLSKADILDYLESIGQAFVTDSTNLQDEYTRNKIRLRLLPLLQAIHPSARNNILQTAGHIDDAALVYRQGIEEGKKRVCTPQGICIRSLLREVAPEALLFEILRGFGFNGAQVHDVFQSLAGQAGKTFHAPGADLIKDREYLLVETDTAAVRPQLQTETVERTADFAIPRDKAIACLDADKIVFPLSLRRWRHGDSFVPFGMKGRKKVSDYLTDRKFSLVQKARQWVLCCGEDIVWLVGERPDDRFCVRAGTRRILMVKTVGENTGKVD